MGRTARVLTVLSATMAIAVGCGGVGVPTVSAPPGTASPPSSLTAPETPTLSATAGESATDAPASATPAATPAGETAAPTTPPTPPPTDLPTPEPTPQTTPTPTVTAATQRYCTGSVDQLRYVEGHARNVPWPYFCAKLPTAWTLSSFSSVEHGSATYSLSYEGPDGAWFHILQGGCFDAACRPEGTRVGEVRVAGQSALLYRTGKDSYSVWVESGAYPSWRFTGSGVSQEEFKKLLGLLREFPA